MVLECNSREQATMTGANTKGFWIFQTLLCSVLGARLKVAFASQKLSNIYTDYSQTFTFCTKLQPSTFEHDLKVLRRPKSRSRERASEVQLVRHGTVGSGYHSSHREAEKSLSEILALSILSQVTPCQGPDVRTQFYRRNNLVKYPHAEQVCAFLPESVEKRISVCIDVPSIEYE